jgi:hypothetical protein
MRLDGRTGVSLPAWSIRPACFGESLKFLLLGGELRHCPAHDRIGRHKHALKKPIVRGDDGFPSQKVARSGGKPRSKYC